MNIPPTNTVGFLCYNYRILLQEPAMPTNKDGLDPTKPVDFETHQRILREQREAKRHASESKRATKAGRSRSKKTLGDSVDTQSAEEAGTE